ncbi:RTA1 like protein-domain-containing protein [Rhexocercosporidium sp. MPI-PUGE-AT-0058]|nr:RTA1 like protein-domain-containing protein [Rhexocercosporidium sp. MPI-PUGE-AT-0058]
MNAFSYMVLGRMIHFYIPDHRLLRLKASTFATCFVLLDIICFIIQLIGGGMAGVGAPPEQMKTGLDIYKAGIALQEVFVILFIGLAIMFQLKMRGLQSSAILPFEKRTWPRLLYAVYASLTFISARIVFRLVEFSHGTTSDNQILNLEWYQYVFDSIPIFFAGFVLVVCHPGMFMQGPDSVMPVATWRKKCALRRERRKKKVDDEYNSMLLTQHKDVSTGRL